MGVVLTSTEAMQRIGISRESLYKYIRSGQLRVTRHASRGMLFTIDEDDLRAFVAAQADPKREGARRDCPKKLELRLSPVQRRFLSGLRGPADIGYAELVSGLLDFIIERSVGETDG